MGACGVGMSTFSGLVDQFEQGSQYGLLTDKEEAALAEVYAHADSRAALASAHLAKKYGPHGTPDSSHRAAVRLASDGSREVESTRKTPVLKLTTEREDDNVVDSDGGSDFGEILDGLQVRVIQLGPGMGFAEFLAQAFGSEILNIEPSYSFPDTEVGRQLKLLKTRVELLDVLVNQQHQGISNKAHNENLRNALDIMARLQIWFDQAAAGDGIDTNLDAAFQDVVGNLQKTVGHILYHTFGYDFTQPGNLLLGNKSLIENVRKAWDLLAEEVPFSEERFGNAPFALGDLAYHSSLTGEALAAYTKLKRDICQLRYVLNWKFEEEGASSRLVADCMELSARIFVDLEAVSETTSKDEGITGATFYYSYVRSHMEGAMYLVAQYFRSLSISDVARIYGNFLNIADRLSRTDWQIRFPDETQHDWQKLCEALNDKVLPSMARGTLVPVMVARWIQTFMAFLPKWG